MGPDSLHRYISKNVQEDLKHKMVFVGGPRQVGKTTFALQLLGPRADESSPTYFIWDNKIHRERQLKFELPNNQRLLVLDEIHKYAGWRNGLKGYFETHKSSVSVLVTGSARLDYYRKRGDSLQGRYHYYRLHPLSLREINAECKAGKFEPPDTGSIPNRRPMDFHSGAFVCLLPDCPFRKREDSCGPKGTKALFLGLDRNP